MGSVRNEIEGLLDDERVRRISERIGADPQRTRQAVNDAVPVLLGALGAEATNPQRANGLKSALERDHDGSIIDDLEGYLSGRVTGRAANGDGIVEHALGERKVAAQEALSQRSGLSMQSIGPLLAILAPIVMGMLAKKQRSGEADDLGGVLGRETADAAQSSPDIGDLIGSVLGGQSGGIGDLIDSVLGGRRG
jgi:hypothetical protein